MPGFYDVYSLPNVVVNPSRKAAGSDLLSPITAWYLPTIPDNINALSTAAFGPKLYINNRQVVN